MKDPRKGLRLKAQGSEEEKAGTHELSSQHSAPNAQHPPARPLTADLKALLHNPSFIFDTVGMLFMTFAMGGIAFFMPRYIIETAHLDEARANTIFGAIVVVAGLAATIAGGIVGDALRPKLPGSYFLVSSAGLAMGFPLFLAVLYTPFPLAWIFVFLAVFCLFFNTGPSNTILANVTRPELRATAFAVNILVIHALGDAISPVIIGAVADARSLRAGFVVVSITFLLGAIAWALGAPHLAKDTAAANDA